MSRFSFLKPTCLALLLLSAGCTDFIEPNQLAFVLGTAIDDAEDGQIKVSMQVAIPSQLGGPLKGGGASSEEGFIVVSALGKDVFEATQRVQSKLSRRLMTSHRIIIALSERYLNHNDIRKIFDKLIRDPANNLRDTIVLVKGGEAKELLMIKHPMERISSVGADKELKINGINMFSSRQLIIDNLAAGIRPILPVMSLVPFKSNTDKSTTSAELSGFAVLNANNGVQGILDVEAGYNALWLSGKGTYRNITIPWKDGQGRLSFRLTHLQRKIRSANAGNAGTKRVELSVRAYAYLIENTTSVDISDLDNMIAAQKYMNDYLERDFQETIARVRSFGTDVFGIGEFFHRRYPEWWNSQKSNWDTGFKSVDVTVKPDVRIRSIGLSGAQLKSSNGANAKGED